MVHTPFIGAGGEMCRSNRVVLAALVLWVSGLAGCQDLAPHHLEELFRPSTELSEIVGFLAGLGPTFAAFQILWIYYGMLIASRPVIIWNVIAVFINFLTVGAYAYFLRKEKEKSLTAATESKTNS